MTAQLDLFAGIATDDGYYEVWEPDGTPSCWDCVHLQHTVVRNPGRYFGVDTTDYCLLLCRDVERVAGVCPRFEARQ